MASKRQLLLDYLNDTLLPSIKTSSGYQTTVRLVQRGYKTAVSLQEGEFPAIFLADNDETRENITHNQFKGTITLVLVAYARAGEGAHASQKELDKLIEDITKCLETDRLQGGRALGTEVTRISAFTGDAGPHATVAITVEFFYASEGVTP